MFYLVTPKTGLLNESYLSSANFTATKANKIKILKKYCRAPQNLDQSIKILVPTPSANIQNERSAIVLVADIHCLQECRIHPMVNNSRFIFRNPKILNSITPSAFRNTNNVIRSIRRNFLRTSGSTTIHKIFRILFMNKIMNCRHPSSTYRTKIVNRIVGLMQDIGLELSDSPMRQKLTTCPDQAKNL